MEYYTLNNGIKIPALGLGTYKFSPHEAYESVLNAIKLGYELIDTAQYYENEVAIGNAIKDSLVSRDKIFLSTKIWPSYYLDDLAVEKSLKRLKVDYIDLMFLHQPCGDYIHAYKILEKAYEKGLIRSIGLSNFEENELDEILKICKIKPQVMQLELHPYYQEESIRVKLLKEDIQVMSWYPLGHGDKYLLNEPILNEMSNTYYRTNAQLLIKWQLEHRFICIPGAHNMQYLEANLNSFNYSLKEADIKLIDNLNKQKRYYQRSDEKFEKYLNMSLNLDNQIER